MVWFGEGLNRGVLNAVDQALDKCDMCLLVRLSFIYNEWMNEWMLWFSFNNNNNNNNNDIIINSLLKSHKNLIKTTHKTSVKYS